ncbi:MAG: type II/IV secretion system protein [Candidatus Vogelbacteria bacterium]|nr:type II/IV secretion system protein [Candidatus Vogelbacteria bacterium]
MWLDPEKLKQFILESDLMPESEVLKLGAEAKSSGQALEEVFLASGQIKEDDFRRIKAYLLGIPFVSLKKEKIERDTLFIIPEPIARRHNIVAFRKKGDELEVAMLDPDDLQAIEFIKKGVGLKILPRLTDNDSIRQILLQYQKSLKAEFGDIIQTESRRLEKMGPPASLELPRGEPTGGEEAAADELKKLAEGLPVVKIVDTLLLHAILQQASDIHVEPYEKELVIRYRIDGVLHDAMILPKTAAAGIIARIKILSDLRLDEKRLPQDGRFKIESAGQKVSFRVSVLPTFYGEKTVMRLLPDAVKGFTLEQLGFHSLGLERIHEGIRGKTGIILVTGPTGSGKTTTLYTILDLLNQPDVNISTIEDPIEYQIPRINQTQVKPEIGLTFANGLRALVRQDPDIVMVGEIRDEETANLAINAALTGHLVLSTLHTNSAAATIPRLLDMRVEPFLLVSTVRLIVSQRLVRQFCAVRESYSLTETELKKLKSRLDLDRVLAALKEDRAVKPDESWSKILFYHPQPSAECPDGYTRRVGIHEAITMSPAIKELVMKGETAARLEEQAKSEGMLTMLEDGVYKAARGITSLEEVFRVVSE